MDSVSTVSTLESELDEPTAPTTWTPQSSPGGAESRKRDVTIRTLSLDEVRDENVELTRMRTFGEKETGDEEKWRMELMPGQQGHMHGRNSVGVAF